VDPTLTTAEVEMLSGMRLPWANDVKGMPVFSGDYLDLEIFQYNDGTKPEAKAIFDNLELRSYEIPPVGIERAMRLTWPASVIAKLSIRWRSAPISHPGPNGRL
jgi:hypothetical protein